MQTRRTLIESTAAMLLLAPIASAQNKPAPPQGRRNPILQQDLPHVSLDNWSVTAVEVAYGPGEGSTSHSHPGITIVYVLEGEVRSRSAISPSARTPSARCSSRTPVNGTACPGMPATPRARGSWRFCSPRRESR